MASGPTSHSPSDLGRTGVRRLASSVRDRPPGRGSPRAATTRLRSAGAGAEREILTFSDLLPYVLHDRQLRERLARLYAAYRSLDVWCLSGQGQGTARLDDVAALNVAVVEGLGLQRQADPVGFDAEGPIEVWEKMVELYLDWAGR